MKICESCGEQNWKPQEKCIKCNKKMQQSPQQKPREGDAFTGVVKKCILHDDYGWTDTHGD